MLKKFMSGLNAENVGDITETRRRHSRITDAFSTITIDDNAYAVKDWSQGGVFFQSPKLNYAIGDIVHFNLTFKMPFGDINVPHSAKITRKGVDGYAAQFCPLNRDTRTQFARVMDGVISRGFDETNIATYH